MALLMPKPHSYGLQVACMAFAMILQQLLWRLIIDITQNSILTTNALLSSFFLTNKHAFSISFSAKSNVWQNDEGCRLKINLLELFLSENSRYMIKIPHP